MANNVEGEIERIGYNPAWGTASKGVIYIVLVDDNHVYASLGGANNVYADVGSIVKNEWLLLLTQKGDHVAFEAVHKSWGTPFSEIESGSLRNLTLEKRLGNSLRDVTPPDQNLPHFLNLPGDNS